MVEVTDFTPNFRNVRLFACDKNAPQASRTRAATCPFRGTRRSFSISRIGRPAFA